MARAVVVAYSRVACDAGAARLTLAGVENAVYARFLCTPYMSAESSRRTGEKVRTLAGSVLAHEAGTAAETDWMEVSCVSCKRPAGGDDEDLRGGSPQDPAPVQGWLALELPEPGWKVRLVMEVCNEEERRTLPSNAGSNSEDSEEDGRGELHVG